MFSPLISYIYKLSCIINIKYNIILSKSEELSSLYFLVTWDNNNKNKETEKTITTLNKLETLIASTNRGANKSDGGLSIRINSTSKFICYLNIKISSYSK